MVHILRKDQGFVFMLFSTILTSDTNLFQPANGSIENKMEDPHTLKMITSACVNAYLLIVKSYKMFDI